MEKVLQRIADVLAAHAHTKTDGSYHTVSYEGDNLILVYADDGSTVCLSAVDLTERPSVDPVTRSVRFVGQAWINGHAVAVDYATVRYGVTEAEYQASGGDDAADYDYLQTAAEAPLWVKHWAGPFNICPESGE